MHKVSKNYQITSTKYLLLLIERVFFFPIFTFIDSVFNYLVCRVLEGMYKEHDYKIFYSKIILFWIFYSKVHDFEQCTSFMP